MAKQKLETGIRGLDSILDGGFNQGQGILLKGPLGSGKTATMSEFIYQGIQKYSQAGVYVTLVERPEDIVKHVQNFGWDFQKLVDDNKLSFVDLTPAPELSEEISSRYSLTSIIERIKLAVSKTHAKRVVIDGIDFLYQKYSNQWTVKQLIYRIYDELKAMKIVLLVSAEYMEPVMGIENYISDSVIELSKEWRDDEMKRVMKCVKTNDSFCDKKVRFDINQTGVEFFPKSY